MLCTIERSYVPGDIHCQDQNMSTVGFNLVVVLGLLTCTTSAYVHAGPYLNGYGGTIHGATIDYRSCQPDANSALLARSLDSTASIEWLTAAVPADVRDTSLTFVWIYGINGNQPAKPFHLSANGVRLVTFMRPADITQREWSFEGSNGTRIEFRTTFIDNNDDAFGYAFLTVGASLLSRDRTLRLAVHGESVGSSSWYMTFQHPMHDTVAVSALDGLLREGKAGLQPVYVDITTLHEGMSARASIKGFDSVSSPLAFGFNRYILKIPRAERERSLAVRVAFSNGEAATQTFIQSPIREWTVYMVQHAHTDIGYTRPQSEILPEHLRFIDYALDYCDQTDSLPDDARFRWTCEASWPVWQYLKERPAAQIARLKRRIREGRIEVTGMMFNMSELPDENTYVSFLEPIRKFQQMGIHVVTGMQDDVNGVAWCLVDYFHNLGIKYLTMGENPDRALRPFDIPTSFWWQAPSGNRLLVYRADHYMTGNFMGIERGSLTIVEPRMFEYLQHLEEERYPFDRVAVQYSGYYTDNSPPSTAGCRVIEAWNKKYLWPHLRSATDHEFPSYVAQKHATDIQTMCAAWPDWWTDGTGSAPRETAAARRAQGTMNANEGILAMARLDGATVPATAIQDIDEINDNLLFYDEHTFGAAESISDPLAANSEIQWGEKSAYVWDAVKKTGLLQEYGLGLLQHGIPRSPTPTITAYNTLGWQRSGVLTAYIDNQILPPDSGSTIVDANGHIAPAQLLARRSDGCYWGIWVDDVPPMGYKTYRIERSSPPESALPGEAHRAAFLENRFYRITFDTTKGTITGIVDKGLNTELVDASSPWKAAQFIRETMKDREQMARFQKVSFDRAPLTEVHYSGRTDGPIWNSVTFTGRSDAAFGPDGVSCEVRLFNTAKRIEIHYSIRKRPITSPEAIYVAFPFALKGGSIRYDVQGGVVTPGVTQIPGSSSDWQTVQSFAAVRGAAGQILLGSDEAPLVQFGDINTGKYQRVAEVRRPYIYSWVMNNYWTTNFLAEEDGVLQWTYYLTSMADTTNSAAAHFGWASRIPLVPRVLPANAGGGTRYEDSLFRPLPRNLLLVDVRPSPTDDGVILQLRETDGRPAVLHVANLLARQHVRNAAEVNVLGERIGSVESTMKFRPYEVRFLTIFSRQ